MVLPLLRVSVLVSLVGFPLMLDARTLEEHPQVFVSVLNDAGVDNVTVLSAEKLASWIYGQAGLSIIWKNCLAQPELKSERCIQTVDNRHLVLHIVHRSRTLETSMSLARGPIVMSSMIESPSCTIAAGPVRQRSWVSLPHMSWDISCSARMPTHQSVS